ncbi:MAG: hypothetical protein R2751_07800 [Bacteroidales bacterium]
MDKDRTHTMRTPFLPLFGLLLLSLGMACSRNSFEGQVIAVETLRTGDGGASSRLVAIDPDGKGKAPVVLTEGFADALAPALSHDAGTLYFQGKKNEGDAWKIWGMDLTKRKTWQVTFEETDCRYPVSMPDGTVVFSRYAAAGNDSRAELWKTGNDTAHFTQLTYNRGLNVAGTILKEGRILCLTSGNDATGKNPVFMVMRPDGTKAELYHACEGDAFPVTTGREVGPQHVYFINNHGQLARLDHHRPLHTGEVIAPALEGTFLGVTAGTEESESGESLWVTYRNGQGETGLYRFNAREAGLEDQPLATGMELGDILLVKAVDPRPRILPSEVDVTKPTAILMSQDINHSRLPAREGIADTVATRIRISGAEGILGETVAKADGSFYVKLDADTPFRIETLNEAGETVRGPSSWLYLRPSERRACVGCHADQELAPENVQPLAVKEDPVMMLSNK